MWLLVLSDQLPIVALVGSYPTNQQIGHRPIPKHPPKKALLSLSYKREPMRACRRFLAGIPHFGPGHPCVTHPSATPSPRKGRTFDLHVLGTPPAFILSQDQTRHPNFYIQSLKRDRYARCASLSLKLTGMLCYLVFLWLSLFSCSGT